MTSKVQLIKVDRLSAKTRNRTLSAEKHMARVTHFWFLVSVEHVPTLMSCSFEALQDTKMYLTFLEDFNLYWNEDFRNVKTFQKFCNMCSSRLVLSWLLLILLSFYRFPWKYHGKPLNTSCTNTLSKYLQNDKISHKTTWNIHNNYFEKQ